MEATKAEADKYEIHCPQHGCFQELEQATVVFVCFEDMESRLHAKE
jgi:hypothetical protein